MSSHVFELPSFEIEGKTYSFKRLGARAAQDLGGMIKTAWTNGVLDLNVHLEQMKFLSSAPKDFNPEISGELVLFFSIDHCLDQFQELMSRYLVEMITEGDQKTKRSVALSELEDADLFPLYSLVTMAAFFTAHPDLSMFVSALNEGKDLPFFQSILRKIKEQTNPKKTTTSST